MTHELKDKRILFFSPAFFGYEKVIKSKLSLMCKECVFFDERPSSSTSIPPNSIAVGCPARVIKQYNFETKQ